MHEVLFALSYHNERSGKGLKLFVKDVSNPTKFTLHSVENGRKVAITDGENYVCAIYYSFVGYQKYNFEIVTGRGGAENCHFKIIDWDRLQDCGPHGNIASLVYYPNMLGNLVEKYSLRALVQYTVAAKHHKLPTNITEISHHRDIYCR